MTIQQKLNISRKKLVKVLKQRRQPDIMKRQAQGITHMIQVYERLLEKENPCKP